MEKHWEVQPEIRTVRERWIADRWAQLNGLEKEWAERAFKFLLLTNSGGAIAVLSFLGTSSTAIPITSAKYALLCFSIGIVLVGAGTAQIYHRMSSLLKHLKADTKRLYEHEISFAALIEHDTKRSQPTTLVMIPPYLAFTAFICGCAFGGYALFSPV